jgi:hypothetical protein
MKKIILALVVSLALLVAFGQSLMAGELPKEGTFSVKMVADGRYSVINAATTTEKRMQFNHEGHGVTLNDAGEGFLHDASFHAMGAFHAVNGVYDEAGDRGFFVFFDSDRDQVLLTYVAHGSLAGTTATFKLVGGTGKYIGITGGGEWTWKSVTPAAEGTFQGYILAKGHYKLP